MVVTSEQSFDGPVIDATFRITSTEPGRMTMEVEIFKPETLRGRIYGGAPFPEGRFTVTPTGFSRLQDAFSEVVGRIAEETGVPTGTLMRIGAQNPAREITTRFSNISSESLEIPTGTTTFSKTVSFPTIKVPTIGPITEEDVREAYFNLPRRPSITMSVTPTNPIERFVEPGASVEFEIPASAVIEPIDVDADCGELYQDLSASVMETASSIERQIDDIMGDIGTAEAIKSEIESDTGQSLGSVSLDSLVDLGEGTVSRLRNEAQSLELENNINIPQVGEVSLEGAIDRLDSLEGRVDDEVGLERCTREFKSSIEEARSELEGLRDSLNQARATKETILNALEGFEGISCDDIVPSGLRGRVDRFNNRARNLSVRTNSLSDVRSLLDEGDSLIQDIESRNIGQGCGDILVSEVEDSVSRIRSVQRRLERIPSVPEVPEAPEPPEPPELDCGDVDASIRAEVSSIENRTSRFRRTRAQDRTEQRREELISRAQDTIDEVNQEVDSANPCKGQLRSRLRRAIGDVRNVPIEEPGPTPCFEQFSSIDNRVDDFEEQVVGMRDGISTSQLQQLTNTANQILNDIEQDVPQDSRCRERFVNRVRSAVNRAQSLVQQGQRGQIIIDEPRDDGETQQRLRRLRERLNQIIQGAS